MFAAWGGRSDPRSEPRKQEFHSAGRRKPPPRLRHHHCGHQPIQTPTRPSSQTRTVVFFGGGDAFLLSAAGAGDGSSPPSPTIESQHQADEAVGQGGSSARAPARAHRSRPKGPETR